MVVLVAFFVLSRLGGTEEGGGSDAGAKTSRAAPSTSTAACGVGAPDDGYSVAVEAAPGPPPPEGTAIGLTVRHDGRAVSGAKVCLAAEMPDMQHAGITAEAKEGPGGRYDTVVRFGMAGSWTASVTIVEPGKPVVSVTVPMEVAPVVEN